MIDLEYIGGNTYRVNGKEFQVLSDRNRIPKEHLPAILLGGSTFFIPMGMLIEMGIPVPEVFRDRPGFQN